MVAWAEITTRSDNFGAIWGTIQFRGLAISGMDKRDQKLTIPRVTVRNEERGIHNSETNDCLKILESFTKAYHYRYETDQRIPIILLRSRFKFIAGDHHQGALTRLVHRSQGFPFPPPINQTWLRYTSQILDGSYPPPCLRCSLYSPQSYMIGDYCMVARKASHLASVASWCLYSCGTTNPLIV